jgi:hypothetical protein
MGYSKPVAGTIVICREVQAVGLQIEGSSGFCPHNQVPIQKGLSHGE